MICIQYQWLAISPHRLFFMFHLTWIQFSHLRTAISCTWVMCPLKLSNIRLRVHVHVMGFRENMSGNIRLTCWFITFMICAIRSALWAEELGKMCLFWNSHHKPLGISYRGDCRGLGRMYTYIVMIPWMMYAVRIGNDSRSTKGMKESKKWQISLLLYLSFLHFYTYFNIM